MALDPSDLAILRRRVRPLVTEELVAEHRADPFGTGGGHSPALVEVLHFLRRNPDPARPRYLVLRGGEPPAWRVARRAPVPTDPVVPVGATTYAAREDAEHAVFLLRLADYELGPER
ncbi:MAG TPA: hypothetical protein VNT55_25485 [Baekduia sp.]|nr:hypothetical protein [Baekduia sp.]